MMSRKVLPLLVIVLCSVVGLWAFKYRGEEDGSALARQQKLLATVGYILEQKHYSPKLINDEFSREIFKKYLESLDPDKDIFLATDIASLKKFDTTIDDEIHGAPIAFFPAVSVIYNKRFTEAIETYRGIMAKPFSFNVDERVQMEADSLDFPVTEAARKETWRKRLKFLTLERFVDLQDQRAKSKATDSIYKKTDAQLEKEAREKVLKAMDRNFNRLKNRMKDEDQFNLFVNTITGHMDPHTNYMPPIEKRAFDEEMSNRFYGIGAQLRQEDNGIRIMSLVPGSPAWKSGQINVNDIIIKVGQGPAEPADITGLDIDDAVKLIRGNKGTEVRLTLKRTDGSIKVVSLMRDEIVQDEAFARSVIVNNGNKKIGYIYLPEFYADFERPNGSRCAADVAAEVLKLKAEHIDGIVLDLRSNGGGSLYEVVQMVGLFIKGGPVVQVKDRDGKPSVLSDDDSNHNIYDGPLAVMVNELSASASEIFAAAIQDYNRGVIVGSTSTFGKGTVQKSLPLGKPIDMFSGRTEYGALKLTFEKFYRVNGGSTQLKGVAPDIVIPDAYEYIKIREKDNSSSLEWDQIAKLNYATWEDSANLSHIKQLAQERINANKAFNAIRTTTEWQNKNAAKEYSLNITAFREDQKKLREMSKTVDTVLKLSKEKEIKVQVLAVDKDKYYNNADKAKGERYQEWLKRIKSDIYIDETARIVSDMVNTSKTRTISAQK